MRIARAHALSIAFVMLPTNGPSGVAAGWSWSKVPLAKAPKVSGQSVGSLGNQGIILFGGLTGPAGSPCTDDTWHWTEESWTLLDQESGAARPRIRMYGASAVLGDKMYLFGGWDPGAPGSGGEFLDDVWEFDPVTSSWKMMDIRLPYPVSRHTACTISAAGSSGDASIILHTYKGILTFEVTGDGKAKLVEKETTGGPDGYSMCAISPLGTSKMLLYGGSTKTQQLAQDAYVLDCKEWVWMKLSNVGEQVPPPLASACAAQLEDDQVLIFGGASIGPTGYEGGMGLIPQDGTWRLSVKDNEATWQPIDTPVKPEGRVAASFCLIGSSCFLLQGGYDPLGKKTFEEPWILKSA